MYIDILTDNGETLFPQVFMANEGFVDTLARDIMNEFDTDKSGALDPDEFRNLVDDLDLKMRMTINF